MNAMSTIRTANQVLGRFAPSFTADVARALAEHGFLRFVVAGGETSGAVVQALGARRFAIGSEIARCGENANAMIAVPNTNDAIPISFPSPTTDRRDAR